MEVLEPAFSMTAFVGLPLLGGEAARRALLSGYKPGSFLEWLPLTFSCGLGMWVWISVLGYALKLHLTVVLALFLTASGLLLFISLVRVKSQLIPWGKSGDKNETIVLLLAVVIGVVAFIPGSVKFAASDSFRHLTFIHRLVERGIFSEETLIVSATVPFDIRQAAYSLNGVYPLYSAAAGISGAREAALWLRLPLLLVPIFVMAFYVFLRRLIHSPPVALSALLILFTVAWFQIFTGNPFRMITFPRMLGYTVFLTCAALLLKMRGEEKCSFVSILAVAVLAASLPAAHFQLWVYFALTLGIILVHDFFVERRRAARFVPLILFFVSFSVLLFLPKLSIYSQVVSDIEAALAVKYSHLLFGIGGLYIIHPGIALTGDFVIPIVFSLAVVIMLFFKKGSRPGFSLTFPAFMVLGLAFLLLCPLTITLTAKLWTGLVVERLLMFMRLWSYVLIFVVLHNVVAQNKLLQTIRDRPLSGAALLGVMVLSVGWILLRAFLHLFGDLSEKQYWAAAVAFYLILVVVGLAIKWFLTRHGKVKSKTPAVPARIQAFAVKHSFKIAFFATALYLAVFLFLPRSILNVSHQQTWSKRRSMLRGPSLEQILGSEKFTRLFEKLEDRSTILTGRFNRDVILAFDDVYITASAKGDVGEGKKLNARINEILDYRTPVREAIEGIQEFGPDYIVLSPFSSHLAWMRFDHYPQLFRPVFREFIEESNVFNKTYVVYEVDMDAVAEHLSIDSEPAESDRGEYCGTVHWMAPAFNCEIGPPSIKDTGRSDLVLVRRDLETPPWYYFECDLGGSFSLHRVIIPRSQWKVSDGLQGVALFTADEDHKFSEVSSHFFDNSTESGETPLEFSCNGKTARYVRIVFGSKEWVPLGEVKVGVRGD